MNKLLLLVLLTIGTVGMSFGQLQIIEDDLPEEINSVKNLGVERFSLSRTISETDTTYYLTYVNNRYKHTVRRNTVYLTASKEEMLELEQVLLKAIEVKDKTKTTKVRFNTKDTFILSSYSTLGVRELMVFKEEYDYFKMTKKEIIRLFSIFHD